MSEKSPYRRLPLRMRVAINEHGPIFDPETSNRANSLNATGQLDGIAV